MNKLIITIFILYISALSTLAIEDDIVNNYLNNAEYEKPKSNTIYNYEALDKIVVPLKIAKNISDTNVQEGEELEFILTRGIIYNRKTIVKRNTKVTARVETIIKTGMNGIPASIIIGNFNIPTISNSQLTQTYEITGQDRSLAVFPLKWALTILPPTGSLTNFIKGGHAKLKTNKTIEIYYYPNWI